MRDTHVVKRQDLSKGYVNDDDRTEHAESDRMKLRRGDVHRALTAAARCPSAERALALSPLADLRPPELAVL